MFRGVAMKYLVQYLLSITGLVVCYTGIIHAQTDITFESFANAPLIQTPRLSPDGKYLAAIVPVKGTFSTGIFKLVSSDDKVSELPVYFNAGEINYIQDLQWANNNRLIIDIKFPFKIQNEFSNFSRIGSINKDGKDFFYFKSSPDSSGCFLRNVGIVNLLENDPNHIILALGPSINSCSNPRLYKVNVYTGNKDSLEGNRLGADELITDKDGIAMVGLKTEYVRGINYAKFQHSVYYRKDSGSDWELLQDKTDTFDRSRIRPVRFDETDPNVLLIRSDYRNLAAHDDDPGYTGLDKYDISLKKVTGPYTNALEDSLRAQVTSLLPDHKVNIVSTAEFSNRFLVWAGKGNHPGAYYILDNNLGRFDKIISPFPQLENLDIAETEKVSYPARDSQPIPAYLTVPFGSDKKNLPVIVYPHETPFTRDSPGFDSYEQFFTYRGYAVFQPQFRGTYGYGESHELAGHGQWGHLIQDDITDGVKWLIEQGIADPARICIVGRNFGGYAASIGLIQTPDLYQCAISINGIHDLNETASWADSWADIPVVQDQDGKLADVDDVSPYHQANKLDKPILLLGSDRDTIVKISQSRDFYKKLKSLGKDVTYIEYENDYGWPTSQINETGKLTAIYEFLNKHLGVDTTD